MRRRTFLAATAAAFAAPAWAEAGAPRYLTAAALRDKSTWLVGLSDRGDVLFQIPIPSRGHAAAAHPRRAEAVAFSRRPGRFAIVLDCANGAELARLHAPEGRHFYGHGAFTQDGRYLLTTENDYDAPAGRLGVWDTSAGYTRVDELPSGGIGPHEILHLAGGGFAVANGGIQTHPDFQRAKLNLPTMAPNLTYLDESGRIVDQAIPPEDMRMNSIRHIDADEQGRIAIALQWQGPVQKLVPLAAQHKRGQPLRYLSHPDTARLRQFGGSVAVARDGSAIAVTGPKGGHVLYFDGRNGTPIGADALPEASGVAQCGTGLAITVQGGLALRRGDSVQVQNVAGDWSWDNHLVRIA